MSESVRDRCRSVEEAICAARELRETVQSDPHRPRYHLIAPEGWTNDSNGAIWWKGRYHLFILGRMPLPHPDDPGADKWEGRVWLHASSCDLAHWIHHPPALKADGSNADPDYVGPQSGDAVENAPVPTLIYHDGKKNGTCIATSDDPELVRWTPLPQNPVIPFGVHHEVKVHDPCAWRQDGTYYALVGGKNYRKGYEGDCTSLFRSTNLADWEYLGPFYRSRREWTGEEEDCACPDFFPLGGRWMLLMHGHRPYRQAHYYLGRFEGERFHPEEHGRMTWPGGQFAGPETLLDGQGRRILFGWVPEGEHGGRDWKRHGWASAISLPRLLSLGPDGGLCIEPVPELEALRANHRRAEGVLLPDGEGWAAEGVEGDCLELAARLRPRGAERAGLEVRRSPGGEEGAKICWDAAQATLAVECTAIGESGESRTTVQQAPLALASGEALELRVFLDRSIVEVFANGRQCMTQRIYPSRPDSKAVRAFAQGGSGAVLESLDAWQMMPAAAV